MSDHEIRSLFDECEQVAVPLPQALGHGQANDVRSMFTVERERAEYEARIAALEEARTLALADASQVQQQFATEVARYADAIENLQGEATRMSIPLAEESVALGLEVARAIIGCELDYDRTVIVQAVDEALTRVRKDDEVVIRVGAQDAAALRQVRPGLFESGRVALLEDGALPVGGCTVETENRVLDTSVDSRLEATREALVEAVRASRAAGERIGIGAGTETEADAPTDSPTDTELETGEADDE